MSEQYETVIPDHDYDKTGALEALDGAIDEVLAGEAVQDAAITLPLAAFQERRLVLTPGLSFEAVTGVKDSLSRIDDSIQWWLGDLGLYARAEWAEDYSQLFEGYDMKTIGQYMRVAERHPPETRVYNLPWTYYRSCTGLKTEDERAYWLAKAEAQNWTKRELEQAIKESRGEVAKHRDVDAAVCYLDAHEGQTLTRHMIESVKEHLGL